jgi:hypothetical protein
VGDNGGIARSADGINWSQSGNGATIFGSSQIFDVAYGVGRFVAVGANGRMAHSTDGVNWTSVTATTFNQENIRGIAYGAGRFVAVGHAGRMAHSANGINWTSVSNTTFGSSGIFGIDHLEGTFVAVGANSGIAHSTDGINWTRITNTTLSAVIGVTDLYDVAYDGFSRIIVVGANGRMAAGQAHATTNWSSLNSTFGTSGIYGVTYGGGRFVAVGAAGRMAHSQDGLNWTSVSNTTFGTNKISGITYSNGRFVAVGDNGRVAYFGSSAGISSAPPEYEWPAGTPLIGGYIVVQRQSTGGSWIDVTDEILRLGVTGVDMTGMCVPAEASPNAIIRLQRYKNRSSAAGCGNLADGTQFWSKALFDAREGSGIRLSPAQLNNLSRNGVLHYVELDIANLSNWLRNQSNIRNDDGYTVYFSDRRGSGSVHPGEYMYERVFGVDLNGDGIAGTDRHDHLVKTTTITGGGTFNSNHGSTVLNAMTPMSFFNNIAGTSREVAMRTRPIFFRRALKIVNGAKIDLGINRATHVPYGLTIVSENALYLQGDYNYDFYSIPGNTRPNTLAANNAAEDRFTGSRIQIGGTTPAAIIADSVTILSNNWNDGRSFGRVTALVHTNSALAQNNPQNNFGLGIFNRPPTSTFYMAAIIAGKNQTFRPADTTGWWGQDGGVNNFLRLLEDWQDGHNIFYRGSFVSLYYSHQAMSPFFNAAGNFSVFNVGVRRLSFEADFTDVKNLPPQTPMVRGIAPLGTTRITGDRR